MAQFQLSFSSELVNVFATGFGLWQERFILFKPCIKRVLFASRSCAGNTVRWVGHALVIRSLGGLCADYVVAG